MRIYMKVGLGLAFALMLQPSVSMAYELNPLKNKYSRTRGAGGFWERISESVHEEITEAALFCANERLSFDTDVPGGSCPTDVNVPIGRGYKYHALIRGVWWNDDPNQLLFGVHYATWPIYMKDAEKIAKYGKNMRGRKASITSRYKMQYRSHYGDLQFLHAMANKDGESPTDVQERVLGWIGFAYRTATNQIEPDTTMENLDEAIVKEFFKSQPGWSVNYLLAPKWTLGKATIRDVALGSILHIIQDSYSESHTDRTFGSSQKCASGGVVQFHAYGHQDSTRHGSADSRVSWKTNVDFDATQNPVETSARMIEFVGRNADWTTEVLPYLQDIVFCIDQNAVPSGPGEYGESAVI